MKHQLIYLFVFLGTLLLSSCGDTTTTNTSTNAAKAAPKVVVSDADKQLAKMANTPEGASTAIGMHTKILAKEYCNCNKIQKDIDRTSCLGRNSSKVRSIQSEYPKNYHDQFMKAFKEKIKNC